MITCLHGFLGLPSDWEQFDLPLNAVNLWDQVAESNEGAFDSVSMPSGDWLMGYSLGARLAMHALIREPSRWQGAILISGHPGLRSIEEKSARCASDEVWAQRFLHDEWSSLLRDWNAQAVLQGDRVRLESDFSREKLAQVLRVWSLGRQECLEEQLADLDLPLLYVSGERDQKFTSMMRSIPKKAPHRHVVIADAGHRVPWENPKAFISAVQDFGF